MIEYLKVEIVPERIFDVYLAKLHIKVESSRKPEVHFEKICSPDELTSFFDQIFDCAKREVLQILKGK